MHSSLLLLPALFMFSSLSSSSGSDIAGLWDAQISCPGGAIKFGLELKQTDTEWQAFLVNGKERIRVPTVNIASKQIKLGIEHYDSKLILTHQDGRLTGKWSKRRGIDEWLEMEVTATVHQAALAATSTEPFAGRWEVKFASSDDTAVGVFAKQDDRVAGTFLTTTGDYRFLDGTVEDGMLQLSCFDGGHAFLFKATAMDDGTLSGDFWSANTWHEKWTAKRNNEASLPDSFQQTTAQASAAADALKFPDLDGTATSINDPKFAGKARIVYVFGSWCPNCHDAAAYFSMLQKQYHGKGLSILGLAFELTGDFERDSKQVRTYVKRHNVEYPILIAGLSDKKEASKKLPVLDRVRSYPTTIFMDRNNQIRAIHTGFSGPATGSDYEQLQQKFESIIEELLADGGKGSSEKIDYQ